MEGEAKIWKLALGMNAVEAGGGVAFAWAQN